MRNSLIVSIGFLLLEFHTLNSQLLQMEFPDNKTSFPITSTEQHRFNLPLLDNEFVGMRVMQKGVDLEITTFNKEGAEIKYFNNLDNVHGPELIYIRSDTQGTYGLEIKPVFADAAGGSYELEMLSREEGAPTMAGKSDQIFGMWNAHSTPGFSLAIVKDGEIVIAKGYGMANLEYEVANGPNTVFHVASLSKQFTVFAILLLENKGILSLDDDVRKYIPELADFGRTITLRNLASHTSGLRDQWNLLAMAGWRMDDVITMDHIRKLVWNQKELNFLPGEEFLYCNTGYTLLAEVVSRLTNESFAEFARKNIFEPLNMKHSQFYDDHEIIVPNRAYSYHHEKGSLRKSNLNFANVGATGLFTTAGDMGLWALNFSEMTVGNADLIKIMDRPVLLNDGTQFGGALGQFLTTYQGMKMIHHTGADAGYRSYLVRIPDEQLSVVVLGNYAEFKPDWVAREVIDIYLGNKFPESETGNAGTRKIKKYTRFVGKFVLADNERIIIGEADGSLYYEGSDKIKYSLARISDLEFLAAEIDYGIRFISDNGEGVRIDSIELRKRGEVFKAVRVDPAKEYASSLGDYAGAYYSEELSTTYRFAVEDGKLVASHSRIPDFELIAIAKDTFSADPWFFRKIRFLRGENNEILECEVSSGRARNVRFRKI